MKPPIFVRTLAKRERRALEEGLIWDNTFWYKSHEVKAWISAHNREVKDSVHGI
jgi:hypothetical protein